MLVRWYIICFSVLVTTGLPSSAIAQKIFLINVADTKDESIGQAVAVDAGIITGLFQQNVEPRALAMKSLTGNQVTEATILATINGTKLVPNQDVLVLYYSGHGAYDENGQYFQIEGNPNRREILAAMERKSPRLAVLISDCCNSYAKRYATQERRFAAAMPAQAETAPIMRKLFFESAGSVDLTSSQEGEVSLALGPEGSLFTVCFNQYIQDNLSATPDWDTVFRRVRDTANQRFKQNYPDGWDLTPYGLGIQKTQIAVMKRRSAPGPRPDNPNNNNGGGDNMPPPTSGPVFGARAQERAARDGVVITELVANSPATRAGLEVRDRIIRINGKPVRNERDYSDLVDASPRNMVIEVVNWRDGQTYRIDVVLNRR